MKAQRFKLSLVYSKEWTMFIKSYHTYAEENKNYVLSEICNK